MVFVAGSMAWSSAVSAQSIDLSIQMADAPAGAEARLLEEFQPIGGRIGSFYLFPVARVSGEVTDNVFANDQNKHGDVSLDAFGALRLVRDGEDGRYVGQVFAAQSLFANRSGENSTRFGGSLLARIGPAEESHWEFQAEARHDIIARDDLRNLSTAAEPLSINQFNADAFYGARLNRVILGAGVGARRIQYESVAAFAGGRLNLAFRDYTQIEGRLEGGYELRDDIAAIVRASYARVSYDLGPEDAAFDPLVDINRDSNRYRIEGGLRFAMDDRLVGDITLGYSKRDYVNQPVALQNSGGLSISSNLRWQANPVTVVRLRAAQDFIEAASRDIAGYRATGGQLAVEYGPAAAWLVVASARYRHIRKIGVDESSDELGGTITATRYLSRRWHVDVSFSHGQRESPDARVAYHENAGRVTISLTL